MKRLTCTLLALALLLSLSPLVCLASALEVTWSGSGDEVRASVTLDNTKNYELSCDLHLPALNEATENGASPDEVMLKIRQTSADHYIIFRVKTYRNADGRFQIQGQQQFYSGGWSDTVTEWSEDREAPINDVRVRISYDAAAGSYRWALSDAAGAPLCGARTDPAQLSPVFKSETACELAFRRGNSGILPANTVVTVSEAPQPSDEFDATKTPGDFGWQTDGDNFTGWKVTADGKVLQVAYDGTNSKRIWQELIADAESFSLSFEVQILARRVELELLGVKLELNTEGGNGNQIYTKDTDWFDAADQRCKVELSRANGGDLQVKLTGDTAVTFQKPVADATNRNLFLGVIDNGGSARFCNVSTGAEPTPDPDPEPPAGAHTPDEFGWKTDEESFNGWTATDGRNITADASKAAFEGWIYKELITNREDFTLTLDLLPQTKESSGSIKVLGVELELDARHGNGNEVCVKINRSDKGWLPAQGRAARVELKRTAGGTVDITVTGAGNDKPFRFSATPAEDVDTLSLCVYAGVTSFRSIRVVTPEQPLPTHTVTWSVNGVETTEIYDEDAMPVFKGDTSRPTDGQFVYTFTGWEPELAPVTADVTYTAQYDKTPVSAASFTITWIVDGRATTVTCAAGETPVFDGDTAKADDARYHYTFLGWDTEPVAAVADATYTAVYSRTLRTITPDDGFGDVRRSDWFYQEVYTAAGYGLFSGTAPGVFSPEEPMTRAMLVTVLYRLEGEPAHTAGNPFRDVPAQSWYYEAVLWAAENGIVNGVGDGLFDPDGSVTREQIATILLRYAAGKGYDTERRESVAYFPDSAGISGYAREAMSWSVAVKLIGGSSEGDKVYLNPQGSATRAEVAAILVRFLRSIAL